MKDLIGRTTVKKQKRLGYALSVAVLLSVTAGCGLLDEGWTTTQKDVIEAEKGWTLTDVYTKIGKPSDKIAYQGLRTGWEEWIYPSGSIFFYRCVVKQVVPRTEGTPMPTSGRKKSTWLVETSDDPNDLAPLNDFGDF